MPETRARHPVFARFYARVGPMMDRGGMADERQQLLAGLAGEIIEVGAGSGLNFGYYPRQVTSVLAVEPERRLRQLALRAAERAPVRVKVVEGITERLPAGDASFDAAVACLVLCSVADSRTALREVRRVVRPGGQLRFFEHVADSNSALRGVQRLLDATVWPALCGGCHLGRDTVTAITDVGFEVSRLDHLSFPNTRLPLPFKPHVRGIADRVRASSQGGDLTCDA
jgi:ubiquinone/menaquinone biosynthesis C-methylase UbiE